jgi:hypothetical protein
MSYENEKALCKHCNEEFPKTKEYFYTSYGKLKLDICKECKKEKSRKNKNTKPRNRTKYMKQYREKNKEKLDEYTKDYREKNKEKLDEYMKQYRDKNREKYNEYHRQRYHKIKNA